MTRVAFKILAYSAVWDNTQQMIIDHVITDPIAAENLAEELALTLNTQQAGNTQDWVARTEAYIVE